jgi:glutamate carboxypeptidase
MEYYTSFFTNNLERYLEILHDMVNINSFTYAPENVNHLGQYTATLFENIGFESIFQPARDSRFGKHLFLIKNSSSTTEWKNSPTIACISHLDTVFSVEEETQNDFLWRREPNKIYGPGTGDIKGGTVMI